MASWLSHSNQKLYQARLLLDNLQLAESSETTPDAFVSALQESVLFQLVLAYQSYLHEIAEIAQCRDDFLSLSQLIELTTVPTGEMKELQKLEGDSFSWLGQLLTSFEGCSAKDPVANKAPLNPAMIQIHDTTTSSLPLRDWYESLVNIIDLQRDNRQES